MKPTALPPTQWSRWWVALWVLIFLFLVTSVWFVSFWHWLTYVVIGFGIPELLGTLKQDDKYPPLTHVIVRYVDREISFPVMFGLVTSAGAFWFGFIHPERIGGIGALLGWLNAHFDRRYEGR